MAKPTTLAAMVAAYPELRDVTDIDELMAGLSRETGWSLAQIVAALIPAEQELILSGMDTDLLIYDWEFWGRPSQMPPKDSESWDWFAMVAGRGAGKTRAGAEWVHKMAMENPGCRIGLVARTAADARDVMIEGDSGISKVGHPDQRPTYYSSKRRLVWPNGSQATHFSSEEPDQLRGPQFDYAWADEAAAWKHTEDDSGVSAWDNLVIATRLNDHPQLFITTTPKRTKFMFDLIKTANKEWEDDEVEKNDVNVVMRRGSTMENAGNLSPQYIAQMKAIYANTRLADQELYGLMLDQVEGALWTDQILTDNRIVRKSDELITYPLKVIAVDPTVAENPKDECGIIIAGATSQRRLTDRHAYIIEDASIWGSTHVWATQVVKMWKKHKCPVIVETNQGGKLVADAIHAIDANVPILEVRATQGKALRAEPVTLKYDQGKVHHVGAFAELEAQMTSWVPGETKKSPDRVDAMVYAITALLVKPPSRLGGGKMRAKSLSGRRLPSAAISKRR